MISEQLISIVIPWPSHVSEESLCSYVDQILQEVSRITGLYEVIVVTDHDSLQEQGAVSKMLDQVVGVRILFLNYASHLDIMIMAGFSSSIGDHIVVLSAPLDPPSILPQLIEKTRRGVVAVGVRKNFQSEGWLYRFLRPGFYFITNKLLGLNLPKDTTYLCAFPRQAVTQLNQSTDRLRLLKVVTSQIGWPIEYIDYQFLNKADYKYRNLTESFRLSIQLICSLTVKPLAWSGMLTCLLALLTLGMLVLRFWKAVPLNIFLPVITIFLVSAGFSIGMLVLYLAHYLWSDRTFPVFFIKSEICSKSMFTESIGKNIVNSAT